MANVGARFNREQAAGFAELKRKIKQLDERTRVRTLKSLLRKEAGPVRTLMRQNAYKGATQGPSTKEVRAGWTVYNLKRTIGVFVSKSNKDSDYVFAVIGGRSTRKKGAPYFKPQNAGEFASKGRFPGRVPKLQAKDFVEETERQMGSISAKTAKQVDRYIQKVLSQQFK